MPNVSLTSLGTAYTQDFDTLSNTAGSTTNTLAITGWSLTESGGGARDNEQYAVDTGGSGTGDTYSYGTAGATDRALGGLQSGTLIPSFGVFFDNNTGSTIASLTIAYKGEEWRLGTAGRTDQLDFQYSLDATSLTTGTWLDWNPLDFITPDTTGSAGVRVGNNTGFFTNLSSTISALSIANGATFALRWSDANASGADDGLAIDDFSLTANADTTPPTLSATSPTDGETGVTANASIVLTFSETVQAGSGNITITDGGSDVRTIAITDPQVTISGATVTINPTADLNPGAAYDVIIPSGVITDAAGNPFAGIVQDALDFTIAAAATVSIADAGIAEGDSGTTVLTFTVSRSDNTGDFTVDYTTADVTAAAGDDYVAVTGAPNTIHFTAGGALTQQISITINGDTTAEPNESFTVDLGNLVNTTGTAIISDGSATGTIINEDPAPLVINEIDADQTGADTGEFIELFGGANASLDGYVVVLYNGSNDQSYAAFDLDGFSLDGNGHFVLGNSGVANVDLIFANNSLQNGADAVAVYLGNAADFPNGSAVTATNLVDAVVYENNLPDDRGLIDVLTPGQAQVNESERGAGVTQSLQRVTDGAGGQLNTTAFTQAASTPGAANVLPATAAASGTVTHLIHDVQGAFAASPLSTGTVVTIEGIVVGDFQSGDSEVGRSLNGFYLEEETGNWDPDPLTSEGIFIFGGNTDVHEGDLVRVTGTVSEFFGMTEVSVTGVTVVTAGAMPDLTPLRVDIDLPTATATLNQNDKYQPDLEAYEGMYVRIPETLTITEQFQLDRFNEIKLSANGQLETYTNEFEPSTPGYSAYLQQIGARTITYDDGQNTQNESINYLSGFDPDDDSVGPSATFPSEPGYATANAFRMGDTVSNLSGVLDYQFGGDAASSGATWRVRAIDDGANTFAHANPRPDTPPVVGGTLNVASFNVLNYFTTLDAGGATTAIGLAPRGANTAAEFQRQTDKLVNFIATLDADVLGLTELENDFFDSNPNDSNPEGNAIAYLVAQLNARLGADTYAWINPGSQLDSGQFFGGDAISVGFIYKPSKVEVSFGTTIQKLDDSDAEAAALLGQSTIGHIFNGINTSRASLAVTFHEIATNEDFTAVINHFKSKSGNGTGVDADQGDGQGAWQNQRELAAQALTQWIATHPTGTSDNDVLLLGDFNAYLKEDAVDLIEAGGFHNLAEERIADPHSFVFDAQSGALDHAFASNSLDAQVTGIDEWHANSDEADALDYNLDFDRDPRYFDPLSVARESDHDPVVLGLALNAVAPTLTLSTPADNATDVAIGANIVLTFSKAVQAGAGNIILRPGTGADILIAVGSGQVSFSGNQVTINPTSDLSHGVAYDVIIGSGVITGLGGDPFGGIAQDALDFTTTFVNTAPVNTVPAAQSVDANGSLSISGLAIADADAQSGTMTTTLAVAHGTIAVASAGGASISGSGTDTVTLTGTLAQINTTFAASHNVVYAPTHDFVGNDTLTVTTRDNGNTGTGGTLTDTDEVKIVVANPTPQGTPGDDSFTAPDGSSSFDALGGIDTVTFGFKLVDAAVSYLGNAVIIDGPSSHTVLTGFEKFVFTDGAVDNNDGNPLVDDLFYYSRYHDVWNAHASADDHYNGAGWHEGRDPDAFFSTLIYLSANPDVKAAGVNPLTHFDQAGWKEGRIPSLTFDPRQYLAANPDVAAANVDPLAHFLQFGAQEGRQPLAPSELTTPNGFDFVYYLQHNPDVAAAHVDPFQHFQTIGWKEGRNPNALFDVNGYLATYGDVAAAHVNPLDHYNQFGWHEGRDPSVGFDTTSYLAAYADVAAAHVNPLAHFLHFGIHEGRSPFADGVWG